MADQRRTGAVILAVGLALVVIGAVGLATGGDAGTTASRPSSVASPAGPAAPTPPLVPTVPPSAAPTDPPAPVPSPSPDTEALVAAFFADLVEAIRAGSVGSMGDRLHPAVIGRYGEVACAQELASRAADPGFDVAVVAISASAPWDYVTDERTTTIEETLTVDARVTSGGTSGAREFHVTIIDGEIRWFTDCGTLLGAPPSP